MSRVIGYESEKKAQKYLQGKGLCIVHNNYSCRLGEIDLIMQDGDVMVFIEVRARATTLYGAGYETVSFQKQKKIIKTAKFYQVKEDYWGDVRFDVVSITRNGDSEEDIIEHIRDAFDASY